MLMNTAKCKQLTKEYVDTASGLELHLNFKWTDKVGGLPLKWNWLVGEYINTEAKNIHTLQKVVVTLRNTKTAITHLTGLTFIRIQLRFSYESFCYWLRQ